MVLKCATIFVQLKKKVIQAKAFVIIRNKTFNNCILIPIIKISYFVTTEISKKMKLLVVERKFQTIK